MKYAIYFLAIGDAAWECLEISYDSLRKAGFKCDIYILSDRDFSPFKISQNTQVLKLKYDHINLDEDSKNPLALFDVRRIGTDNPRNLRNPQKWTICRAKTLIDKYVSFDKYDYIVYLDVDVLVNGPVEDFNNFLFQKKGTIVTAQNQGNHKLGGRGNFSFRKIKRVKTFSAANLTNVELFRYWFVKAICSDIVCIPTDNTGKRLMEAWRTECQKDIDFDQPALQAVLLRDFHSEHQLAPYSLFGYGQKHNEYVETEVLQKVNSTFVHFGGAIKDASAFKAYYKRYLQ